MQDNNRSLIIVHCTLIIDYGRVTEWPKVLAWKASVVAKLPRVRISPLPQTRVRHVIRHGATSDDVANPFLSALIGGRSLRNQKI